MQKNAKNIILLLIYIFGLFLLLTTRWGKVSFELGDDMMPVFVDLISGSMPGILRLVFIIADLMCIAYVIRHWKDSGEES